MSKDKKASYVETIKRDTNADGHFDTFNTKTYTYDPYGKLTSEGSRYESALDGTNTYSIFSYEYNKRGKPVRKVYQQDPDGDGNFDNESATVYRYSRDGTLQEEITQSPDRSGDGNPDYKTVIAYIYNDHDAVTSTYTSYYYNEELLPNEYRFEERQYDEKGNLVKLFIDDPVFYDFIVSWTYKYNEHGKLLTVTHYDEFDYGPDGSMVISSYAYDRKGRLETETQYGEQYNGTYNEKLIYSYDYGKNGKLVGKVLEVYRDADGPVTGVTVSQYQYDRKGNLTQILDLKDLDGDGVTDKKDIYKYFYNEWSVMTAEVHDYGNDGIIDHEYTKSPIDPGLLFSDSPLLV